MHDAACFPIGPTTPGMAKVLMRWQWDLQKQWEGQGWVFLGMLHCMDKICCTTRGRFFFMEFTLGPGEHVQG